jgi:hypothetical protein
MPKGFHYMRSTAPLDEAAKGALILKHRMVETIDAQLAQDHHGKQHDYWLLHSLSRHDLNRVRKFIRSFEPRMGEPE